MLNLDVCQEGAESLCPLAEEAQENAPVRAGEVSVRGESPITRSIKMPSAANHTREVVSAGMFWFCLPEKFK